MNDTFTRPRRRPRRRPTALDKLSQAEASASIPAEKLAEHEEALRATGIFDAALPEPEVLREAPEEVKAKLTRAEQDKISLADALKRAAEIDANDNGIESGGNKFEIDRSIIPAGWHYEWRRDTVLNERDPAYQVDLAKRGWRAVPLSRHPELMPLDWTGGNYIIRGGQILMEIPKAIADRVKERDLQLARDAVRAKEQQLSGRAPNRPNTFERRGQAVKEFGPILHEGESAYKA